MGLLDDAIREHLDLKRLRGADPTEVARLEHEALGPVRREPAPAEANAGEAPAAAEPPQPASEGSPSDDHAHVLAPEDRHEPPHGDPLFQQPAPDEPEPPRPAAAEPPPEPAPPKPDVVDQPTTEYRVEDHHDEHEDHGEDHGEQPADDVLEETPDFLQETPEHDRLWFEQRPPRDFDFDG